MDLTIINSSTTCSYAVGLAIYKKYDENIDNQELYDYQLAVIPPNSTLVLTVDTPPCAYQADGFYGNIIYSFAGGVRYNERKLDYYHGNGTNYCTLRCILTPTPVPPTNTPGTPSSTPTNTPTQHAAYRRPIRPRDTATNTPTPPTNTPTDATNTPLTRRPTRRRNTPTADHTHADQHAGTPTNTPTNTPMPPTNTPTTRHADQYAEQHADRYADEHADQHAHATRRPTRRR